MSDMDDMIARSEEEKMADTSKQKAAGVWDLEARLEKLEQGATKDAKMIMTFPKMTPDEHGEISRVVFTGTRVRVRIAEIEPPLPMGGAAPKK